MLVSLFKNENTLCLSNKTYIIMCIGITLFVWLIMVLIDLYSKKKFKLLNNLDIVDENIDSIVLHYTLHGCMGQDEELTWIGIIERQAPDSSQGMKRYEVKIIGYSDKSLEKDENPLRYIHACQLLHKRNGY